MRKVKSSGGLGMSLPLTIDAIPCISSSYELTFPYIVYCKLDMSHTTPDCFEKSLKMKMQRYMREISNCLGNVSTCSCQRTCPIQS